MNSNDTYPSNLPDPLDYNQLKEYGLEYIRSIANKQWTDFNLHDPGMTILEALCFALTDLAFRTRFGMADLLTPKGATHPQLSGTLFPAHKILSHEPITINDYRKFILESVPGVRNVWIKASEKKYPTPIVGPSGESEIQIKGLYDIYLELEDSYFIQTNKRIKDVVDKDEGGKYAKLFNTEYPTLFEHYVRNFMLKHRNLCEDVHKVKVLTPVPVGLFAEIETEQDADYKQILTEMYSVINAYVSPSIDFHTLPELLKKGKTPAEIYQGLLPRYGFIDLDELEHFGQKKTLYTSDILNLLMKIEGVKSIKRLLFTVDEENKDKVAFNSHNTGITLTSEDCVFSLSPFSWDEHGKDNTPHNILFNCEGYSLRPKLSAKTPFEDNRYAKYHKVDDEYPLPQGKYRNTETYYSFQHLFPKTYRLGMERLPDSASNLRKAERMQLKAYLTFFDQLLADYLAQLTAMERYFAIDGNPDDIEPTYFFHELQDSEIMDVKEVLKDMETQETDAVVIDRRNRIMDHLLARFNDSFADYAVLTYLSNIESISANDLNLSKAKSIGYKKKLLNDYAKLSGTRSQAIDYTENLQISNLERRIMARLGITEPRLRIRKPLYRLSPTLASSNKNKTRFVFNDNRDEPYEQTFGIHIIEHLLLFPYEFLDANNFLRLNQDDSNEIVSDPYSFHVTVVVPGWLKVCQNMQFRAFVESTIRSELPAHVVAKICWIDPLVMWKLEKCYDHFVESNLRKRPFLAYEENETQWKEGIDDMVAIFHQFKNLYFHSVNYRLTTFDSTQQEGKPQAKVYYEGWQKGKQVEELPRIDYVKLDPWHSDDNSSIWKFKEKKEKQTK